MESTGTRRGREDVGEFVRLATALDGCVAYNPKQWRRVLDKSATMLHKRKTQVQHPLSRDEDAVESDKMLPPLSLKQYLNQPDMVKDILKEVEVREDNGGDIFIEEEEEDDREAEQDELLISVDTTAENSSYVVLPLLSTMSPRTRSGLALLPPPSEAEMREVESFERSVDHPEFYEEFYRELKRKKVLQDRHAANSSPVEKDLLLSASFVSPLRKKRPRGAIKPLNTRIKVKIGNTTAADDTTDTVVSTSAQQIIRRRTKKRDRSRSYNRLILERDLAEVQHGVAEYKVKEIIHEIKQWVPLEVVYACGLGKFASPAQQRAAELLFRVGTRLRNQLLVMGMRQWKQLVLSMREQEWELASVRLQCWWRQLCAKRELITRKKIRRELQRRQEAFLALLASKQNQAASKITRCIKRYALRKSRERAALRHEAAVCIQKFWRKIYTYWEAVRREMQRQQRNIAAVCIQKHARRIIAQRRRILLRKIAHVKELRRCKAIEVATRAKNLMMVGAAISIQRTFRNWQLKRVLMLRRRRAAFERDKNKILKVQAHYRGQQARRWANKHRRDVPRAVLTLQCAWRCFLARSELWERKKRASDRRSQILKEIEENRRKRKSNALSPIQLQKKWGHISLLKTGNVNDGSNSREAQAARQLQARWRGKQIRKRLRYDKAKKKEKSRRDINRKRRRAAVCIQRHFRGIRGRAYAWKVMELRCAERIQRVWRGYKTRIQLLKMRYAIKMINRAQARWKARRNIENHRLRSLKAATIQRAARRFIGRRMIASVVRRRQYLAEENEVGKVLDERTRSRVKDELLLQSFVFKSVKTADKNGESNLEEFRVDRMLCIIDPANKQWKRKGYHGIWQEVFRDASGNSQEMDNSHFARFLKSLPHAFIHKTNFPMQKADVIFAKMKEPKAKVISFPRFNKAIMMLLKEKFADSSNSKDTKNGSEPGDSGDNERFLRLMNRFVVPSTIQNGKYRKLLDKHCTKRMLWSVGVLRRFAIRIATKKKHDKFVIIFHEQQIRNHQSNCAATIQQAYRCYKFRLQLKATLAKMFIEFVDHNGRTVKFQHIASGKMLTKRPIFLKGVRCSKSIPLPFPGEELHTFCERHEDSTDPNASRIPAEVYCVECEDTMCKICFDRDHMTRKAFQKHQPQKIQKCSNCKSETATRECLQCGNGKIPFCDSCFPHVHKQLLKQNAQEAFDQIIGDQPAESHHKFQPLVVMCAECSNRVAQWSCETCLDVFCKRCMSSCHAKGQRQYHHCHRLNYFSILRQKAEQKRNVDAEKERERRQKQREEERRQQEAELKRQNIAATKMQALIRSFIVRQAGKAYMKLVRQTQAARAQRIKDNKVRSSILYKVRSAFGMSPALKSDTKQEIAARHHRLDTIKRTLFLQQTPIDQSKPTKKHWSKEEKARGLESLKTWCDYDEQVKILKGEWKNCVGSIVSTQNLMLTGSVLVFVPLANRSVVVRWVDIEPCKHEEALRQAYESPRQLALNVTRDFHAKISGILEAAVRKARLLYLQTIEFKRITQYAWVAEFNKHEQKVEYWNVVLNRRIATPPKAMEQIERMEREDREKLEKRVELARSKLVALLNPFQPKDKPKLSVRRNGIVFVPNSIVVDESNSSVTSLKREMEAIDGARFWHDKVVPNRKFGGKKAKKFLKASTSTTSWPVVKLFIWMDLHEDGGFEPHAKKLMNLSEELQVYMVNVVSDCFERSGAEVARDKLFHLMGLKEATLQLLATKYQRDGEEAEAAQM